MLCMFCGLSDTINGTCPRCGTSHPTPETRIEKALREFDGLSVNAQGKRDEAEARRQRIMQHIRG